MSFKIRAAAVAVATSLIALPLAGTAFAQDGGSICGVVRHDVNADGTRQAGEGPVADRMLRLVGHDRSVEVEVRLDDGVVAPCHGRQG